MKSQKILGSNLEIINLNKTIGETQQNGAVYDFLQKII